jgi:hypothetical protein
MTPLADLNVALDLLGVAAQQLEEQLADNITSKMMVGMYDITEREE